MQLESFATGVLKTKKDYKWDKLIARTGETFEVISKWKETYEKDEGYWQEIGKFIHSNVINDVKSNTVVKAEVLRRKLDGYLTNDAFFIIVSDDMEWKRQYSYQCSNEKDQIIGNWHGGNWTSFVYRSRTAYKKTKKDYEEISNALESCKKLSLESLMNFKKLGEYGFFLWVDGNENAQFKFANWSGPLKGPGTARGPGWNTRSDTKGKPDISAGYDMIVAFE